MNYSKRTHCRICGTKTIPYFDFGPMPLVNQLFDTHEEAVNAPLYPLELQRCPTCYNSQLSVVVNPEILYDSYPYRSSVSRSFRDHCNALAQKLRDEIGIKPGALFVDIAGNDGAFLREVVAQIPGATACIVDPSGDALDDAPASLQKWCAFWGEPVAAEVVNQYGHADVITAQNVVAHVDFVQGFFAGVKAALKANGVFVVEVPHVLDMIQNTAFETVYHEHLSYMSLTALQMLGEGCGLRLFSAEKMDVHCGTLRAWFCHVEDQTRGLDDSVRKIKRAEERLGVESVYANFAALTRVNIADAQQALEAAEGMAIGFPAAAKGNIILNMLGDAAKRLEYIIDETPAKQGRFAPGCGAFITGLSREAVEPASLAVILAQNVETELTERLRAHGFAGEVYTP